MHALDRCRNGRNRGRCGGGLIVAASVAAVALACAHFSTQAQPPRPADTKFKFQVVQSVDAEYVGDAPAHMGRGSLELAKPDISLGDPVFSGDVKVGTVTKAVWDRVRNSLEVEFAPYPYEVDTHGKPVRPLRIAVGQDFWIPIGGLHGLLARDH
jgi:hypothetical protein